MSYSIPKRNISSRLRKDKVVLDYAPEEIAYLATSLGKASYDEEYSSDYEDNPDYSSDYEDNPDYLSDNIESSEEDKVVKKKKTHWSDRLKCPVCAGMYTRSAVTSHRGTKKHQIYAKANKKLLNLMRDD